MPSHTWNEVGRWGDSVRANLEAWHSDLKAAIGEGFAIYPEHNLHMLLYAASMDGQGAIAMRAGKDYAKLTGDSFYQVLTLDPLRPLRRSARGDEPARSAMSAAGLWDFAQGYAQLQAGQRRLREASISRACRRPPTRRRRLPRAHRRRTCSASSPASSTARFSATAGDLAGAIAAFERAVVVEDGARSTTSPSRCRSPRATGSAPRCSRRKRFGDAETVYRDELTDHPHNGWSLLGLQQALAGQGVTAPEVDADLAASWSRADTWTRASRF